MLQSSQQEEAKHSTPPISYAYSPSRNAVLETVAVEHDQQHSPISEETNLGCCGFPATGPHNSNRVRFENFRFARRMTVIRLADHGLFIHSPTKLVRRPESRNRSIGGASLHRGAHRLHDWWASDWRAAFANAAI